MKRDSHFLENLDLIVIGAGHAGCEAAMAAANMGLRTLLVTSNADRVGHLSCNPAIGGLGKGHMVREIDALGGYMAGWADEAAIQVRTLNASKGPAVRATRAQVDREVYMNAVKRDVFNHPSLLVTEDMAVKILADQGRACGITTLLGQKFLAGAVLVTAGTFMRGQLHMGEVQYPGGRRGDGPSPYLSHSLEELGFKLARFMTCTTPRVLKESVDFSVMEIQHGDTPTPRFSRRGEGPKLPQLPCYLTWTNENTHQIIEDALRRSPMYNGDLPGAGPRYCPAIEDKIARFPEKGSHQIFVEPEGVDSAECYPNNIPTGLPLDVQIAFLRTIRGFECAHVVRPGYAIGYDVIIPTQLKPTLEAKNIENLWFAGQINGTSGYEEAAAQGMWATLNIAAKARGRAPFLPGRDQAYMAVMVDDLVTKGTNEPYRMFTSRAEHRLLLRESNADLRLTPLGREHGLVKDEHWSDFTQRKLCLEELTKRLNTERVTPDAATRQIFERINEPVPGNALTVGELFRRPDMTQEKVALFWPELTSYPEDLRGEAETEFRYAGYVERQSELVRRQAGAENISLPESLDYTVIAGLTTEAREKLSTVRPATLGQASRIPGITPAALACIEIELKKLGHI